MVLPSAIPIETWTWRLASRPFTVRSTYISLRPSLCSTGQGPSVLGPTSALMVVVLTVAPLSVGAWAQLPCICTPYSYNKRVTSTIGKRQMVTANRLAISIAIHNMRGVWPLCKIPPLATKVFFPASQTCTLVLPRVGRPSTPRLLRACLQVTKTVIGSSTSVLGPETTSPEELAVIPSMTVALALVAARPYTFVYVSPRGLLMAWSIGKPATRLSSMKAVKNRPSNEKTIRGISTFLLILYVTERGKP